MFDDDFKKKKPVKDNTATIDTTRTIIKANSLPTEHKSNKINIKREKNQDEIKTINLKILRDR